MYAITGGERAGGFIVWIKEFDSFGAKAFLYMPHPMEAVFLTDKDIDELITYEYLDFADRIDPDVYAVIRANWKFYADKQGLEYESK